MQSPHRAIAALLLLLLPFAAAQADDPWSGNVRLGYLSTSGNAESDNLNARLLALYEGERWGHRLLMQAIGAREEERTTAEAYEIGGRSSFDFNEFDFIIARVTWRRDRFSGYDRQLSESIGYGRRIINTERQHLNLEIGAGARQARTRAGDSVNEAIVRAGSDYQFRFNDQVTFNLDLAVESGDDNTFSEGIAAVRSQLMGRLALVASYTLRHNSRVPAENTRTDTYTSLSLEYSF